MRNFVNIEQKYRVSHVKIAAYFIVAGDVDSP